MDNTIDTNLPYVNAYNTNTITPNSVEKLTSNPTIEKVDNNPASPSVAQSLEIHQRELSQSISTSITGIALANVAQSAITQQKDILNEIRETIETTNEITDETANKIANLIQNFESITNKTTYNGEKLLETSDDTSDDLSIVQEEKIVSLYKVDTASISSNLRTLFENFTTDPSIKENLLNTLDQNINELASFEENYSNASNILENSVKEKLTETKNSADEKTTIPQIDFAKEVTDFNKTNLLAPAGYLMQTQANAHTSRTVDILK